MALLEVVDSWNFAIDDGLKFVCIFLHLRKAFDVIKYEYCLPNLNLMVLKERSSVDY